MTRHIRLRHGLIAALLLTTSAVACGKSAASAPRAAAEATAAAPPPPSAPEPGMLAFADGRTQAGYVARDATTRTDAPANVPRPARASDGRKIVRNGSLEVRVDDYEPARAQIDALLRSSGGFIANAQVGHSDGRVTEATLVLRVPAEGYEDLVARLSKLGTIVAEASNADDVTDQWVDVTARLANAKKLEGRLIELVATQAGNVTQLLEVERELATVREQIELFEGRLHVLDDQVSLSTLTLKLSTRVPFVAAVQPTFGGDAGRTLAASWTEVRNLGRGLALGAISLVPWLPLLAAAALVVLYARRRVKRGALSAATAPASR